MMNRLIELADQGEYSQIANSLIEPTYEVLVTELKKTGFSIKKEKIERIKNVIYLAGAVRALEIHKLLMIDKKKLKTTKIKSISERIAKNLQKSIENGRFCLRINLMLEDKNELCDSE